MYVYEQHDGFNALPLPRTSQLDPGVYAGPDNRNHLEAFQGDLLQLRLEHAIEIPIDIEQRELDEINRLISPLIVKPSEQAIVNHAFSTHPRNFVYTFLCEMFLAKHSDQEIGPNMFKCQKSGHLACMKMDAREADRVIKAMLSKPDFDARYNSYLRNGCCVDGAEKCTKKTSALACSNVLYHLDMKNLFKLFKNKAVNCLLASMVFPKGLREKRSCYDPEHKVSFQMLGENGKHALMTFGADPSNGYLQDVETWIEYLDGGIKDGRKYGHRFNLFFEHFKVIGNMHLIRITKTTLGGTLWQTQLYDPSQVHIVDWTSLVAEFGQKLGARYFRSSLININKLARCFEKLPRFTMPVELYSQVCAFLFNRPDDRVDRQAAGAILGSKMYQVVINQMVLQRGYTAGAGDYSKIATLLLLKSWIGRATSSKIISHFTTHILKVKPLGIMQSLSELFAHAVSREHILAEEQRIARFAKLVMGTTPEHVFLCDLLLNDEKTTTIIYKTHAKRFTTQDLTYPENREYIYDPLTDGNCYKMCVSKAGGHTDLGPNPTQAQVDADIEERGYSDLGFLIEEGHCKLQTFTNQFCQHGVSKNVMKDDVRGAQQNITDLCDNRWIANEGRDNYTKTKFAFEIMKPLTRKSKLLNGAAMPGNDELFWQSVKKDTVHWADSRYDDNRIIPLYPKNHLIQFDKNVFCGKCRSETAFIDQLTHVFFDLGSDSAKRHLAVFYATALKQIRSWQPNASTVVKIQDLRSILESGKNRMFLEEVKHWRCVHGPELQANEFYVVRNDTGFGSTLKVVSALDDAVTDDQPKANAAPLDPVQPGKPSAPPLDPVKPTAPVLVTAPPAPLPVAPPPPPPMPVKPAPQNTSQTQQVNTTTVAKPAPLQPTRPAPPVPQQAVKAPAPVTVVKRTPPSLPDIDLDSSDDEDDEFSIKRLAPAPSDGVREPLVKSKRCGYGKITIIGVNDLSEDVSKFGVSHNDRSPYGSGTAGAIDVYLMGKTDTRKKYEKQYRAAKNGFYQNIFGAWNWKSNQKEHFLLGPSVDDLPNGAIVPAVGTGAWNWKVGKTPSIIHHLARRAAAGCHFSVYTIKKNVEELFQHIPDKQINWFAESSEESESEIETVKLPACTETRHLAKDVTPQQIISGQWRQGEYEPKFGGGLWDTPLLRKEPDSTNMLRSKYYPKGGNQPANPVAFYRSDLLRLVMQYGSDKLEELVSSGMLQYDDLAASEHADIPFDGRVVCVQNNTVYGPLYEELPMVAHPATADFGDYRKYIPALAVELKSEKQKQYKALHKDIGEILAKGVNETKFNIELMEGTYGSGKSYWLKKLIDERHGKGNGKNIKDYLIVCPSSALAREYKEDKYMAMSWSTAISALYGLEHPVSLYIDEIMLIDPRVTLWFMNNAKNVVAVGDRRQMRPDIPRMRAVDVAEKITDVPRLNVTRSTPCDVVALLNKEEPYKTTTRSRVLNSFELRKCHAELKGCKKDCKEKHEHFELFSFDNAHTARYCSRTIASIQGLRRKEVHIVATSNSKALINNVQGQKLVALTRHTSRLVVHHSIGTKGIAELLRPPKLGVRVGARDRFDTPYGDSEFQQVVHVPAERHASEAKQELFSIDASDAIYCVKDRKSDVPRFERDNPQIGEDAEPALETLSEELETELPTSENKVVRFTEEEVEVVLESSEDYTRRLSRKELIEQAASVGGEVQVLSPLNYAVNQARSQPLIPLYTPVDKHEHTISGQEEETEYTLGDNLEPTTGQGDPGLASEIVGKVWQNDSNIAEQRRHISVDKHRAVRHNMRIKNQGHLVHETSETNFVQYAKLFGIHQENNPNHQLATAVERYGKVKTAHLSRNALEEKTQKLQDGFMKFVDINQLRAPTSEEYSIVQTQAVLRAAAKRNQKPTAVYGETWHTTSQIKCFNKQQLKAKGGNHAELALKADEHGLYVKGGQMVSAQPKEVNQVVAPHINWAERIIFGAMRKGVYPGYGASPRKLRKKIRACKITGRNEVMSTDVSEQDTTKDEAVDGFIRWVYRLCGVPDHIIDTIELPNRKWRMKNETVSMSVVNQMQSGRADTLLFNTCYTMALVGMSYDIRDLKLALFQGDDCCIIADSIHRTADFFKNLKEERHDVGEFISFLVADNNLFLDIVRVAAKVLSKSWSEPNRFEELRVAVKDGLALNGSFAERQNNVIAAAHRYGMSVGDVGVLYDYLVGFSTYRDNAFTSAFVNKAQAIATQQLNVTWHFWQ